VPFLRQKYSVFENLLIDLLNRIEGTSIYNGDAPDIRPDNLAFSKIRYPARYRIFQIAEYPANLYTIAIIIY
jgi:hypothetical protein